MSGSGFNSSWHIWGLCSIVLSLGILYYHWHSTITRLPASIPWAGVKDEAFSKPRAWIREFSAGFSTLHEGYLTHNKKGKPFVLLDTAGRPNVIIPKEFFRWLVSQPDHILDPRKVFDAKFALRYLLPYTRKDKLASMHMAIRRDLTRNLGRTQKATFETIRAHIDQFMGVINTNYDNGDNIYTELNLVDVIESLIKKVSSQMLVGDELFHNKAFMQSLASFGNALGLGSALIGQFLPFFLSPVIGSLAGVVVRAYWRRALKFMVPVVQKRIDRKRKREDPGSEYEEPMDLMQWVILSCPDMSSEDVAAVLLSALLAATHPTASTTIVTFLDLLSSPPELGFYEAIAEEAASVFHTEGDFWNVQSLHKLSRIDSAIRESMRLTPLNGRGMMKEVVHPNGVTLPDGQKIPLGAWLGVSHMGISLDERYHPDPHTYDPFKFSRARTEIALMESNGKNGNTDCAAPPATTTTPDKQVFNEKIGSDVDYQTEPAIGKFKGTADHNKLNGSWLPTVTEEFASFGLGRHSCPGRWFASNNMKTILAYIALNYEIQPINYRPPNIVIGDIVVPPRNVMIKVRKRKVSV